MTFQKSSSALAELTLRITNREQEVSYSCGVAGDDFVLAPGRMTFIGAPPGTGKTALASQICFEALEHHRDLKLWIANAEMEIDELLIREISRRSSVGHKLIRTASFDKEQYKRIMDAAAELADSIARVHHMIPPFDGESLGELALHDPGILVVDYVQKFRASDRDTRSGVDEVVNVLRELALEGWSVLAMSATSRQQNGKKGGHDHSSLSLSSFKESGEIEFNADAAYVLRDVNDMPQQFLKSEMEVAHLAKTIEKLKQELRSTISDQIEMIANNATRFHHPRNGCDCDMSDEVCDLCRLSERWAELSK